MTNPFWCCCGNNNCQKDCLFGPDTEDGCCHFDDTLVLWNMRPQYSVSQHYLSASCETCRTESQGQMQPVQSIYKFYDCFWRVQYCTGGPQGCVQIPNGDGVFCGEGCVNPVCNPQYGTNCVDCADVCCGTQVLPFPNPCLYNTWFGAGVGGLSNWRRKTLHDDDATRWFIETVGHKNGNVLGCGVGRLRDDFVFVLFHEKWWRIASECPATVRIYVPGCNQGVGNPPQSDCGGIPFIESDLVPKWWIFACAGVPIYQFEIDDALDRQLIDQGEYDDLMNAIANKLQPPQAVIAKFAAAGYGLSRDWRAKAQEEYAELHFKFPLSGWNSCIQNCEDMPLLAPFRKRLTEKLVTSNVTTPCLHKNDVIPELASKQGCMFNYQGDSTNQDDYNFWRDRQWVYFSGVPGGWTWAGWNSSCNQALTEEQNILEGCGRGVGIGGPNLIEAPMLAFAGNPRPPANCTSCPCVCSGAGTGRTCCDTCINACASCGTTPIASCNPPSVCRRFIVAPECEGVRFIASQYIWENDVDSSTCSNVGEYKCMWSVQSFLTTARRSLDSWTNGCPYTCRFEKPPLGPYYQWDPVVKATIGEGTICADLIDPNHPLGYAVGDLCCGHYCFDFDYNNCASYPCAVDGPSNPCIAVNECPPHNTQAQDACIGHDIDCP